jgi:hypothetical protein
MRPDLTKSQRRRIRELAGTAHDRELSVELAALEDQFARWRRNEIDAHELSEGIHAFHQGPNRRLFLMHTGSDLDVVVASAIARGILTEEEATPEIVGLLSALIEYAREANGAGRGVDEPESGSAGGGATD